MTFVQHKAYSRLSTNRGPVRKGWIISACFVILRLLYLFISQGIRKLVDFTRAGHKERPGFENMFHGTKMKKQWRGGRRHPAAAIWRHAQGHGLNKRLSCGSSNSCCYINSSSPRRLREKVTNGLSFKVKSTLNKIHVLLLLRALLPPPIAFLLQSVYTPSLPTKRRVFSCQALS